MAWAVLTRELDAGSAYVTALAALELDAVAMPVTRTEPPADPAALSRALTAGGHAAIVIASARGAEALIAAVHAEGPALPPVWAVGPATLRALAAAGIAAVHPVGVVDGAGLAHALVAAGAPHDRRVLLARAEDGRDDAARILRAAGVEVDEVIAYRTVAVAAQDPALTHGRGLILDGLADVVAVFAPSQVAALVSVVGPLDEVVELGVAFAAIGETTGAALRAAGVPADRLGIAAAPTPEGLANAISAVYPIRT